jgi:cytochrome c-type biogenesis protein CcmH
VSRRLVPLWTILGVVLIVALLIGSGAFSSSPPTNAQRAAAIESIIRCPSCEDLTVAVSSAPTAVTVRSTVTHLVDQGWTDAQIKEYLVDRYGSAIVLDPPTSGWSALVWALPIAVGLAAVTGLIVVLGRRRRRDGSELDADVRGAPLDPAVLEDRRRFLVQSLSDADAEFLAGDLSDADYLSLRQRDLGRLAALGPARASDTSPSIAATASPSMATASPSVATATATLTRADLRPEPGAAAGERIEPKRRPGRNAWFLAAAVGCFAVALIVAVPLFTSTRLPGQTATGSLSLSASQQLVRTLDQAAAVENQGNLELATQLYQSVLSAHPDNEVAMAQLGWLEFRIGQQGDSTSLIADAQAKLNKAEALDPDDYAVHLYLGTVLLEQDANAAGAVGQFNLFLADSPPAAVVSQAASTIRNAFNQAGQPVPAGVPAA